MDEGYKMKMKDEFKAIWGFCFGYTDGQTDVRTDICDCRVAFATEKLFLFYMITEIHSSPVNFKCATFGMFELPLSKL